MRGEFPVDRFTWLAIEPVISETVESLSRRLEVLEKKESCKTALVKRVEQILGKKGPRKGVNKAKAVDYPQEVEVLALRPRVIELSDGSQQIVFQDINWRPRVNELLKYLRRYKLRSVADNIIRMLPPKPTQYDTDKKGSDAELAHYRARVEAEKKAVRWLLDFLQMIQSEQAKPRAFNKVSTTIKTEQDDGNGRRRRRGRKKADYATEQREANLATEWNRARQSGIYKPDFAREHKMKLKDFEKLLGRVRRRNSRADK